MTSPAPDSDGGGQAGYRLKLDSAAINKVLRETMVPQGVARAAGKVRDQAKQELTDAGRVRTGALRNSIVSRRVDNMRTNKVTYEVGSELHYARAQHEGVQGPIRPKRAKVLRFKPRGSASFVFAKQVAGFRGVPYLTRPLNRLTPQDFGLSG